MFDIHCHLLPDVDDGAVDFEDSLKMCKLSSEDGVRAIIATPHYIDKESEVKKADIYDKIRILNEKLSQNGLNMVILPGMEIFISNNLVQLLEQGDIITLNDTCYMLVEFPLYNAPPNYLEEVVFDLELKGITPVLAHPERCSYIHKHPNIIYEMIKKECLVQINCGSLLGNFGKNAQKTAVTLLEHGMVHFVASDNHSMHKRFVSLIEGYNIVEKKFGKDMADTLFIDNPDKLIKGEDIIPEDPALIKKRKLFFWQGHSLNQHASTKI